MGIPGAWAARSLPTLQHRAPDIWGGAEQAGAFSNVYTRYYLGIEVFQLPIGAVNTTHLVRPRASLSLSLSGTGETSPMFMPPPVCFMGSANPQSFI
jgi:hypothetical protein